jgi:predicted GTPase
VIEDGPTLSHGEMTYGAGVVAARKYGAAEVVDPRPFVSGSLKETYARYPVGPVLPAMGYSDAQMGEMEQAIVEADVDLVVVATPVDLAKVADIRKPYVRVRYELEEVEGYPTIADVLSERLAAKA